MNGDFWTSVTHKQLPLGLTGKYFSGFAIGSAWITTRRSIRNSKSSTALDLLLILDSISRHFVPSMLWIWQLPLGLTGKHFSGFVIGSAWITTRRSIQNSESSTALDLLLILDSISYLICAVLCPLSDSSTWHKSTWSFEIDEQFSIFCMPSEAFISWYFFSSIPMTHMSSTLSRCSNPQFVASISNISFSNLTFLLLRLI